MASPARQPTACSTPTPFAGRLAFFDPGFRFPQSLKLALGVDRRLPGGIVGTVDLLYTRLVHSDTAVDVNLTGPVGTWAGEGGRTLYGTIDETTGKGDDRSSVGCLAARRVPAAERRRRPLVLAHRSARQALLR